MSGSAVLDIVITDFWGGLFVGLAIGWISIIALAVLWGGKD